MYNIYLIDTRIVGTQNTCDEQEWIISFNFNEFHDSYYFVHQFFFCSHCILLNVVDSVSPVQLVQLNTSCLASNASGTQFYK